MSTDFDRPGWNHCKGTVKTRFRMVPGCNCVILETNDIGADGRVLRYGSLGGIDGTGILDWFVVRGALTDLRPYLPFRNYDRCGFIPGAWEALLDRARADIDGSLRLEVSVTP